MRKYLKDLTSCATALMGAAVLAGCPASMGSMMTPEQLLTAGGLADAATVRALRQGRALATTACTDCHRTFMPGEYSPEAWPRIVRVMGKQAALSRSQMADLERYLVSASLAEESLVRRTFDPQR